MGKNWVIQRSYVEGDLKDGDRRKVVRQKKKNTIYSKSFLEYLLS